MCYEGWRVNGGVGRDEFDELMAAITYPTRSRTRENSALSYSNAAVLGFGYDFAILEEPLKLGSTAGKGTFLGGRRRRHMVLESTRPTMLFSSALSSAGSAPGAT